MISPSIVFPKENNMCGLVAMLGHSRDKQFVKALSMLSHRGLRGRMTKNEAGQIGHCRLPIVGLGHEYDQPVSVTGGHLAFVGEILDFRDDNYAAESDVNTVVDIWQTRGAPGFNRRDGFWSIAVLDEEAEQLHLLCDYLCQKPLYYRKDIPSAASELEPLVTFGEVSPDEIYFASVIKWGYCPDTMRTPYAEIKRVQPGEHVVLGKKDIRRAIVDPLIPCYDQSDLHVEMEKAIKRRVLSSDVPVAVLLSGGLDSSIVYSLARKWGSVKAYFVETDEPDLEEKMAVSAVLGGDDIVVANAKSVQRSVALDIMQEPIDLGSLIPQVALSDVVKERVCLTGDGADELFGGYGRASRYDSQASDVWHELVAWHLPRLDRVMMRNKIEIRSPYLSRRVAEIALGLPWEYRRDKSFLRHVFQMDLPPGLARRKKKPLRTSEVERDRESITLEMVRQFRERAWGKECALSA